MTDTSKASVEAYAFMLENAWPQSPQSAEAAATLRALVAERDALQQQVDYLRKVTQ